MPSAGKLNIGGHATSAVMQRPPDALPYRFGVVGFLILDQFGNFPAEKIRYGSPVSANRIGISDAFCALGITKPDSDQLKCLHLSMRAVGQRHGQRNAIETSFNLLDECHEM